MGGGDRIRPPRATANNFQLNVEGRSVLSDISTLLNQSSLATRAPWCVRVRASEVERCEVEGLRFEVWPVKGARC